MVGDAGGARHRQNPAILDLDASRKAARRVRVPAEVFIVLWGYILVSAGILGYARSGSQSQISGAILFLLITTSYMLILDIDRPRSGGIVEAQDPMLDYRTGLPHHRTELSEHRTDLSEFRTDLSGNRTEMSMRRTGMSIHRTRMSADRTLMSEIRTSLSLIGFGFTIYKAFRTTP